MLHKLSFKRKVIMYLHKKLRKVRLKKNQSRKKTKKFWEQCEDDVALQLNISY